MPVAQLILLKTPTLLLAVGALVIAIVTSIAGVLAIRRIIGAEKLKGHNDVAGPIFSTIGVIYAVLLAFIIITVWQNFDRSNANVTKEANYYADIYCHAGGLTEPVRDAVRETLEEYVKAIVNEEWPGLSSGEGNEHIQELGAQLWGLLYDYQPETEREKIFTVETLRSISNAAEVRGQRLMDARTGINPLLWVIILLGGIITVGFTFFFGSENLKVHLIMTTLLAALTVLILLAILIMDYPFTGDVSISPESFLRLLVVPGGR